MSRAVRLTVAALLLVVYAGAAQGVQIAPEPGLGFSAALTSTRLLSNDDAVEDTLDWRRYFPLAVGNEWHYSVTWYSLFEDERHVRQHVWHIIGDTLIEGRQYYSLQITIFEEDTLSSGPRIEHIRYHDENDHIVQRSEFVGGDILDTWFGSIPCGLGAPSGGEHECMGTDTGMGYWITVEHDVTIDVMDVSIFTHTKKNFGGLTHAFSMYADIGLGEYGSGSWPESYGWGLAFAHVDGRTYGRRLVGSEPEVPLPAGAGITSVYPNPVADLATIEFSIDAPSPAHLDVYDLLGRRLMGTRHDSIAGNNRLEIDLSGLSAGVYIVRLRAAERSDSVMVIKI